jgi:hypothetical protein
VEHEPSPSVTTPGTLPRRAFLKAGAGVATAAFLTACGSSSKSGGSASASTSSATG